MTNLALFIAPPHPLRYLAVFILLWVLPGVTWSFLLARPSRAPGGTEVAVGLGLGVTTTALLTLSLHYLPGGLTTAQLLAGSDALILLLAAFAARRIPPAPQAGENLPAHASAGRRPATGWERLRTRLTPRSLLFAALILLTMTLRLANLGYSEFQGDEGTIMVRAARALEGDDEALFLHQKGPVEILLPMATWRLSGTVDEFWARAPFAYAGILGVLAVTLLGRCLFDDQTGWLAGWLLAISGYHVAFGRTVQYQSVVLFATATGLLALWRWSEGDRARWLLAGAALLAFGGLAHYDAIVALPAALYLVARRFFGASRHTSRVSRNILLATLIGLALLATFYLPYAQSPNFGKTFGYLSGERIGSGGPIYDNLGSSFVLTTVYNSTWYVGALVVLVVGVSTVVFRGWARWLPLALVALASLSTAVAQAAWVSLMALGAWWLIVFLARRGAPPFRLAWLWFGAPFLFFHFLVWDPRTHVLNLFPGAALLAALGLTRSWAWLRGRLASKKQLVTRAQLSAAVLLCAIPLGLVSYYPFWMFVSHTPEVLRTWPAHRHALFPTVYDEIPPFGLFGFPHRAGWKAVGALFDARQLTGPYASNEEVEVTGWYTRGAERSYCPGPELYIVADQVQDEMPLDQVDLEDHYHPAGTIDRGAESLLRLYTRDAPDGPVTYRLHDFVRAFDAATTPEKALPPPPRDYVPVEATLDDQVRLIGYRLDPSQAAHLAPGGSVELTLYWEALAPLERSYHVFTHLYRDGEMWGQADSIPQCGLWPTLRWQPGEVVADRYRLTLRTDTPSGPIPLTVGMYTLPDGTRLPIRDARGELVGDVLALTTLEVAP